ncbi:SDR family oxidoreductase [Echinimonas agarilytica]|uniref:SDR family oxidoreductase n=1 Tax=Echinimonas agarilytica TaxID=1215918 RepID=A0AA42B7U6_9GAMM|nr:SDR family oxidoreductase [Echinimonas agarilytica]MCM2680094.1 SDR family oxidoreductase [Echinimonas agarilytica]
MASHDKPLVVITGANSGVGLQVTRTFSAQGYSLLLVDLNIDVVSELDLPNAMCRALDITDLAAFKQAVDDAEAQFGTVDCLINNAGIMYMDKVDEQDAIQWQRMFNVNVLGLMNGVASVVTKMKEKGKGTIINMGSLGGIKLIENQTVYCGTKHAVHGISEGLRQELALSNVRVTTIAPGAIETNLLSLTEKREFADGQDNWAQEIGGILVPEDIANTMLFVYQQPQHVCLREIVLAPTKQVV